MSEIAENQRGKFSPARHVAEQPSQAWRARCGPSGTVRLSWPVQAARRAAQASQPRRPGERVSRPAQTARRAAQPSHPGGQAKKIRAARVWYPNQSIFLILAAAMVISTGHGGSDPSSSGMGGRGFLPGGAALAAASPGGHGLPRRRGSSRPGPCLAPRRPTACGPGGLGAAPAARGAAGTDPRRWARGHVPPRPSAATRPRPTAHGAALSLGHGARRGR
jgi:hypothetical protein